VVESHAAICTDRSLRRIVATQRAIVNESDATYAAWPPFSTA
jgi:hypothetical protein